MKPRTALTILVVVMTLLLTACGGGGGDNSTPNNLLAKSIQVVTPDPRISYPLEVAMTISADAAAKDVAVSVFAMDSTSDPAATVRQIPLGTETIPQVNAGDGSYTLHVNLPSSMEKAGAYYIGAIIDPVDVIGETNEEDNSASIETVVSNAGNPNIKITDLNIDRLAMLLNTDIPDQVPNALTDPASLLGSIQDVYNADAGATLTVAADGLRVNETIDVEAYATLHMARSDTGTEYDVPLYLWNYDETTQNGRYINVYGKDPVTLANVPVEWLPIGTYTPQLAAIDATAETADLDDVQKNSTTLNFYAPGGLGYVIERAMRYSPPPGGNTTNSVPSLPTTPPPDLSPADISALAAFLSGLPYTAWGDETNAMAVMDFSICVEIRPTGGAIDGNVLDNKLCKPLAISLPPVPGVTPPSVPPGYTYNQVTKFNTPSGPLISDDGYGTKGGGSYFLFGPFDFGAGTSADFHGYVEHIKGGIPITVAGSVYDFMSVTVRAQIVPEYNGRPAEDSTGFKFDLVFLNSLIDTLSTGPVGLTDTISYSVEAPNPPKEKQVFVGPVPVVLSASVAGNIGLDLAFVFEEAPSVVLGPPTGNFDQRLGGSISPFVNVEASASAALGIAKLVSAGVEGVLTLLDERLELFVGTEIDVIKDGYQTSDDNVEFIIGQGVTLSNVFTGPQGKINLFAKYSVPKLTTCKWGFIKAPCVKVKTAKATVNIYSSPALFRFDDILFENKGVELDVVLLPGEDPLYFVP